jgi:hypothetical protein
MQRKQTVRLRGNFCGLPNRVGRSHSAFRVQQMSRKQSI